MPKQSFPFLVLSLTLPLTAAAADPLAKEDAPSSWGLGIAAISVQKPYAGMDRENKALPMLHYENSWLRVSGPGLEVKLPRLGIGNISQAIEFGLVAKYDGNGYEADDAPLLAGMDKRGSGILAGAKASWKTDVLNTTAEWTADVSGHSKGQRFELKIDKTWRLGPQVLLTPRLGATWLDKRYVDYYFGVRGTEATASRAAYTAKATLNTEIGLRTMYLFDRHHSMFLDLGVTGLGKEIKNSPLVDRSTENRVLVGYLYRF